MGVSDLIRDSAFGHLVRLATGNKYLTYAEERDPSLWKKYVNEVKSRNFAHHGHAGDVSDDDAGTREARHVSEDSEKDLSDSERPGQPKEGIPNLASGVKLDPEKGRDIHLIDWYGPDDPENPRNWSHAKKYFVTFEICLLTLSVYIGSSIYTAGLLGVMEEFGVSQVAATLGLTLFVAGYGLGPMVWAPMSEIPFIGRNPVYIGTLVIFVLFQIPTALASNFGMLLAFRFLTGLFGSPVVATGGASIGDMYRPQKQAYGLGIWGISAICGPVLGPLVGGFAVEAEGWRWSIWELMWLSGFCLVFLFFLLPETSSANILYRRTRRIRKLTGDEKLKCEPEIMGEQMTGKDIVWMVLIRPISLNFTEPMVFLLNLYISLIYALLYIWFESFPIVFVGIYHFTLGELGLAFLGILIGVICIIPPFFCWLYFHQEKQFNERGEIQPEKRLPPAMVGGFFVPICLFWFGWSARPDIHWIMPIIGSSFFSVATFLLFQSVFGYLADAYPDYVASVFAGNDFMRCGFGAGFPLFAAAMYNRLGVGWASSLLAFLGIAFIPIPYVLYVYGGRLRKRSKHARKDF
ncbi:MFS general substrate transporter [Mytilinidion resinicola]|uniref:MFS general substrate transporter n=1 Tax=Mytilinidion resinicola TaxID=574789 RepID=A0A6A6YXV5_9PEZI|nr:MFS general substrate transporter [Mytilinidion resinicola]KAF2813263.1 MFS general substrate transporter [Mytilinidion resinicola]